jgi:DNA-binding transcriptional LysR family regulator
VLPTTPHGLRGLAEMWAQRRGKRLQVAMECDGSTFMTRRLVAAGHGCTLLPLAAVQEEVERGQLQAVRLAGDEALRTVAIATAMNRPAASGLWDSTQVLRQVVASLVRNGQWPGVDQLN